MRSAWLRSWRREPSLEQVNQLIADIKSGKHEIDDYRKRIPAAGGA